MKTQAAVVYEPGKPIEIEELQLDKPQDGEVLIRYTHAGLCHSDVHIAHVGSAGYLDDARSGAIDMVNATRSPGSTLKPFIYGLAFEAGLAHPETLIEDLCTSVLILHRGRQLLHRASASSAAWRHFCLLHGVLEENVDRGDR